MKVTVHGAGPDLSALQSRVGEASPRDYVHAVRNWLLSGPKFSEFEGFSRFLEKPGVAAKLAEELPSERWAVVGGYTSRPVATALRAVLLAHGVHAVIHDADYGAFETELLSDDSATLAFRPEHVLICTGHHHISSVPAAGVPDEVVAEARQAALNYLQIRWQRLRNTGATLHQHSFCRPSQSAAGRLDDKYGWGRNRFFSGLNEALWERDGRDIRVIAVDDLQQRIGADNWWSSRWYHVGKLPFNPERQRDYAVFLYSHIAATRGTSRKCLVVDLDDTLWGGVIGDDGVGGIVLGNGTAAGEEFLETCHYIRELGQIGIILGVVSKNDPAIAAAAFHEHKEIPLKFKDFASFKASWQPKSVSLREVVKELNIGMDAVVYLDDNAAECEEVARACPEAIVLQVCQGTDGVAQSLSGFRLFDRLSFTEEDASRAASYAAIAAMQRGSDDKTDLPSFLTSLDMSSAFQPVVPAQIARTAQLFAKTNQFNLTQVKFSEQELTEMLEQNAVTCFVATLDDKFAKHGLVSALTVRRQNGSVAEIANWVMSCRVFNRTLEEFMLLQLRKKLLAEGYSGISARLIETSKNQHVQKLFGRLGFEQYDAGSPDQTFRLNLAGEAPWQTYINEQ